MPINLTAPALYVIINKNLQKVSAVPKSHKKLCGNCFSEMSGKVCPACGYTNKRRDGSGLFLQKGTTLNGNFIIGGVIGSGGFGITYMAYNTKRQVKRTARSILLKGAMKKYLRRVQKNSIGKPSMFFSLTEIPILSAFLIIFMPIIPPILLWNIFRG